MSLRVLSFDFDGCIFHFDYIRDNPISAVTADADATTLNKVITHNAALLDKIKDENQRFSKVVTLVGSNRQSKEVDDGNRSKIDETGFYRTVSCYEALTIIAEHLQITVDKFLLADVYGEKEAGVSFDLALDADVKNDPTAHANWIFDETKLTILYAQMHKIALENLTEDIVFDFFDDRRYIRNNLAEFFNKNSHLMPSNIKLRIHHYDGGAAELMHEIQGTGLIDTNYRVTVLDMASQVPYARSGSNWNFGDMFNIMYHLDPDKLINRALKAPEPSHNITESSTSASEKEPTSNSVIPVSFVPQATPTQLPDDLPVVPDTVTTPIAGTVVPSPTDIGTEADHLIQEQIVVPPPVVANVAPAFSLPWDEAVKNLKASLIAAKRETQDKVNIQLQILFNTIMDKNEDAGRKARAVDTFASNCSLLLKNQPSTVMDHVLRVAAVVAVTLITAVLGFALGMAIGLWTGPGAFISGLAAGAAAAITVVAASGIAGTATAGYGFFKARAEVRKELAAVDTFASEIKDHYTQVV